ncbi:hypothetical protein MUO14_14680 [Halobacillus shinanisalinarum]|uniref:Yip1 domain-containing protein n=1 Tax=Halobacillus shinanisalinarum TaxID=2932258 RepID=A0ABY4GUE6_9BACI|nr:hypothetical protein [Halobacillus shinanisalinarum]UOQ91780.1 hypothetical protein MUO14_14680 [Halobacillus shinanisalinarum]
MIYSTHVFKLFTRLHDQLFKLREAERIRNLWKAFFSLMLLTILTYIWMAWLGLGTDPISMNMTEFNRTEYEFYKAWFIIGRIGYSLLLFFGVIFIASLVFWIMFELPYKKTMIIQMNVLLIMLIERIAWIPLIIYAGLDWYVSPFSFGVVASYITNIEWLIYFFGAISLFQILIIWFQIKCISFLSTSKRGWIITGVILWHIITWAGAASLAHYGTYLVHLLTS